MSFRIHSSFPRFIYDVDDPTELYRLLDDWPSKTGFQDLPDEKAEELLDIPADTFRIIMKKGVPFAVDTESTGIVLQVDTEGHPVIQTELVWYDIDDKNFRTGKNDEILNILMSSTLMKLDFSGKMAEAEAEAELESESTIQQDEQSEEETEPEPEPEPSAAPAGSGFDDLFGVPLDVAEDTTIPETILVSRLVATQAITKDTETEHSIYNEQLRALIESTATYEDPDQFNRYFISWDALIDRAESRRDRQVRGGRGTWLIPIVSDKPTSIFREKGRLSNALASDPSNDTKLQVGTISYYNNLATLTMGMKALESAEAVASYVDVLPAVNFPLTVEKLETFACDNSFSETLISGPMLTSGSAGASVFYRKNGPEFETVLNLSDIALEKMRKNPTMGAFINVASRGSEVKGLTCKRDATTSSRSRIYVTGFLKVPVDTANSSDIWDILIKSTPKHESLDSEFKIPVGYGRQITIYDLGERFPDLSTAIGLLTPTTMQVAELNRGRTFCNFRSIARMFRLYGIDEKQITRAALAEFAKMSKPLPYKQDRLKRQIMNADKLCLPVNLWLTQATADDLMDIGKITLVAMEGLGTEIITPDKEFASVFEAVSSLKTEFNKRFVRDSAASPAQFVAQQNDIIGRIVWNSLTPDQRQRARVARLGEKMTATERIDPELFSKCVAASYGQIYPYAYTIHDTDETRVTWLMRTIDNGELYFANLQFIQRSELTAATAVALDEVKPSIKAGSKNIRLTTGKAFQIQNDEILVWNSRMDGYVPRNAHIALVHNSRVEMLNEHASALTAATADLPNTIDIARLNVSSAVANKAASDRRGLSMVDPLEMRVGGALFRFLMKLDRNVPDNKELLLRILNSKLVILDENNRLTVLGTEDAIMCIHEKAELEGATEEMLMERFGQQHLYGVDCIYCHAPLHYHEDENPGFINGQRNTHSDVLDEEVHTESPYDTSSELESSIAAILKSYAHEVYMTTLKHETIQKVVKLSAESLKDTVTEADKLLTESGENLPLSVVIGITGKDVLAAVGKAKKWKASQTFTLGQVEICHMVLALRSLVQRVPHVLAYLKAEMETNVDYKKYHVGLPLAGNVVDLMKQWINASVAKKYKVANLDAEWSTMLNVIAIVLGKDLPSYVSEQFVATHKTLANGKYRRAYAHVRELVIVETGAIDLSDLEHVGSGIIGFTTNPAADGAGEDVMYQNLSLAKNKLHTDFNANRDNTDAIMNFDIVSGGSTKTIAAYDDFSSTHLDKETTEEGCYTAPSALVMSMAMSKSVSGRDSILQEWFPHGVLTPASNDFVRVYEDNMKDLLTVVDGLKGTYGESKSIELPEKTSNTKINSSDRTYQIHYTTFLPETGSDADAEILHPQQSLHPPITATIRKTVIFLLRNQTEELLPVTGGDRDRDRDDESINITKRLTDTFKRFQVDDSIDESNSLFNIVKNFGVSGDRKKELSALVDKDLEMLSRITSFYDSRTFTGFTEADLSEILAFNDLPPLSGKLKTPEAEKNHVFISKSCIYADSANKIKNMYRLVGLAASQLTNFTDDLPTLREASKMANHLFTFLETHKDMDTRVFSEYQQYFAGIFDLTPDDVQHIIDESDLLVKEININDTMKNLFLMAFLLEILAHLQRISVDSDIFSSFNLGGISSLRDLPRLNQATLHGKRQRLFIEFIWAMTKYMQSTNGITDPLSKDIYGKPLELHEYNTMKTQLKEKPDWGLKSAGLSEADAYAEALEAGADGDGDDGVAAEKPGIEGKEDGGDDDGDGEEDAAEGLEQDEIIPND